MLPEQEYARSEPPEVWIDEVATRFEDSWRQDRPPHIADFVREASPGHRAALLEELVMVDMAWRSKKGCARSVEEYLREFPELCQPSGSPSPRLLEFEEELRHRSSQRGSTEVPPPQVTELYCSALDQTGVPEMIGKYRVLEKLDEGSQAVVYRALHPFLRQEVAIKLSRFARPLDLAGQEQLQAEGRILAGLDHPNLARIHDVDICQDRLFLVLDYVRGRNLAQFVQDKKLTVRQAALLTAKVARAVEAIHQKGVIHQDLKPKNILIDDKGEPRLIDLGLARLRNAWVDESRQPQGGTAAYMAPEQARCETGRIGPKSDVFALGGVLFFLLTGQAPFTGQNYQEACRKAGHCDFDRSLLRKNRPPRRLAKLCLRAMSAEPECRPSAGEFARDLERYVRCTKWLLPLLAAAVLLLAVPAVLFFGVLGPDAALDRDAAPPELALRVWRKGNWAELVHTVPLHEGDEFKVRLKIPARMHASLFLINGQGRLAHLQDIPPGDASFEFDYPGKGQSVPLAGPPGTEVVLACLARSGPVAEAKVRDFWDDKAPWPALPMASVLRIENGQVKIEQKSRDVGLPRSRRDPEEEVKERLQGFLRLAEKHMDHVAGVAFAHREE